MNATILECRRQFPQGPVSYYWKASVSPAGDETIMQVDAGLSGGGYTAWGPTSQDLQGNYVSSSLLPPGGVNPPYTPQVRVKFSREFQAAGDPVQ